MSIKLWKAIAAIFTVALGASAALPATAAPVAKPAQAAQIKAGNDATDFSARRNRRVFRHGDAAYPHVAPPAYYGYRGYSHAPAPYYYGRGADPMYGTQWHGPRGPWAPACARGATC